MTENDRRDPGTGRLTIWGYTERLTKLTAILLIPILIWAVKVQIFMSKGDRWTEKDATAQEQRLRSEWRSELAEAVKEGQLPIAAQRLDRLEQDMREIKAGQNDIRATVQDNKSSLTAIQLLLERSSR